MSRLKYHDEIVEICNQGGKISAESIFPLLEGQDIDVLTILFPKKKTFLPSISDGKIKYQIRTIRFEDDLFYTVDKDNNLLLEKNNKTDEEIEKIKFNILNFRHRDIYGDIHSNMRSNMHNNIQGNSRRKRYPSRSLSKSNLNKDDVLSSPFTTSSTSIMSSIVSTINTINSINTVYTKNILNTMNKISDVTKMSPSEIEALYHKLSDDDDNDLYIKNKYKYYNVNSHN
jgi:hypothetical protein